MEFNYDQARDSLTITLKKYTDPSFTYERSDFIAAVDEDDELVKITITNASRFLAQAIAAGVKIADITPPTPKTGMVWYDADSSMISAFGYDEAEQILEVAFHRTGVYCYYDVPKDVFEGLRDASSQGSYMRSMIIDMYPYEKKRGRRR